MENKIILIDTNILINHFKKGSRKFEYYCLLQDKKKVKLGVSVIALFEYYSGIVTGDSKILRMADDLFELFEIYEVNQEIAQIAAEINSKRKLQRKIELADILIGATALYLNARLLTENKKHFQLISGIKFA